MARTPKADLANQNQDLDIDFENFKVETKRANNVRGFIDALRFEPWVADLKLLLQEMGVEEAAAGDKDLGLPGLLDDAPVKVFTWQQEAVELSPEILAAAAAAQETVQEASATGSPAAPEGTAPVIEPTSTTTDSTAPAGETPDLPPGSAPDELNPTQYLDTPATETTAEAASSTEAAAVAVVAIEEGVVEAATVEAASETSLDADAAALAEADNAITEELNADPFHKVKAAEQAALARAEARKLADLAAERDALIELAKGYTLAVVQQSHDMKVVLNRTPIVELNFLPKGNEFAVFFVDESRFAQFRQVMVQLKDVIKKARGAKSERASAFKSRFESAAAH